MRGLRKLDRKRSRLHLISGLRPESAANKIMTSDAGRKHVQHKWAAPVSLKARIKHGTANIELARSTPEVGTRHFVTRNRAGRIRLCNRSSASLSINAWNSARRRPLPPHLILTTPRIVPGLPRLVVQVYHKATAILQATGDTLHASHRHTAHRHPRRRTNSSARSLRCAAPSLATFLPEDSPAACCSSATAQ